jgi:hypothetical protein
VLRALIDRNKNFRAGELSLEEIQLKVNDIAQDELQEALIWAANTRLVIPIEEEQPRCTKYQLTHEKLIPSVLALVGELSDAVEKANAVLERRTNEWLGNQRVNRFLLNVKELWLIEKQKRHIVWGENQRDKEDLIRRSKVRFCVNTVIGAGLPALTMAAFGVWWQLPQAQLYECKFDLQGYIEKASDSVKIEVVNKILSGNQSATANKQNLSKLNLFQLEQFHTLIAEKIADEWDKADVFRALAAAAGQLGDKVQGLAYLAQLQTAAEKIADEGSKADAFQALAAAAGQLGDKKKQFELAQQAVDTARKGNSNVSAFMYAAEINAQAGNYRTACNLANEKSIATDDAVKIFAIVLREYTAKHDW